MGLTNMKYLVDSNILIYHLNGDNIATNFIIQNLFQSAISRITFIEVMSFDYSEDEEKDISEF
jgi:predicted nucleic acid-binding protein